jgi:hypothetical protein
VRYLGGRNHSTEAVGELSVENNGGALNEDHSQSHRHLLLEKSWPLSGPTAMLPRRRASARGSRGRPQLMLGRKVEDQ